MSFRDWVGSGLSATEREKAARAGSAALSVAYESVSQFTREYGRMFGQSPVRGYGGDEKTRRSVSRDRRVAVPLWPLLPAGALRFLISNQQLPRLAEGEIVADSTCRTIAAPQLIHAVERQACRAAPDHYVAVQQPDPGGAIGPLRAAPQEDGGKS